MTWLILFLHFIALPGVIIAALLNGLYPLAIVNGVAFALMFVVWYVFRDK